MNVQYVKAYLSAGIDEAIVTFVKGMLRYAAAAAVTYAGIHLAAIQPTTPETVVIVAVLSQVIKSLGLWLAAKPETVLVGVSDDQTALPAGELA